MDEDMMEEDLRISDYPVVKPENIEDLRKIVAGFSATVFAWSKDDHVLVDMQTANMMCTVYDSVSDKTKEIINTLIAKSRINFLKAIDIGWKACK